MGSRHQIFIVALIRRRYRCLAAIHNQIHSGEKALERCLALLKIFRAKENRIAIQQELVAATRYDEKVWQSKDAKSQSESINSYGEEVAPFPFIATCLIIGTSFDAVAGYQARIHLLDHNMRINKGANNDGITILDITVPEKTRYCFANLVDRFVGGEEGGEWSGSEENEEAQEVIPSKTPLSASSYLSGYYDESLLVDELEEYPLIDDNSLRQLWEGQVADEDESTKNHHAAATSSSLSDTALSKVLQNALQSKIPSESLAEALTIPKARSAFMARLYEKVEADGLKPSRELIEILCEALCDAIHVDLGPFRDFSSTDLHSIVTKLLERGRMTSLNLSNNVNISEKDLVLALGPRSSLRALYLLGKTHISLEAIQRLTKEPGNGISKIYHTALCGRPFQRDLERLERHNYMVHAAENRRYVEGLASTMDLGSRHKIAGAIWVCVDGTSTEIRKSGSAGKGVIDWQKIAEHLQEKAIHDSPQWPSGFKFKYGILPLQDAIISPTRLVDDLVNFQMCHDVLDIFGVAGIGASLAKAFTTTCSSRVPNSHEIGTLPGALYAASTMAHCSMNSPWPLDLPKMVPGQWTVIIIHEFDQNRYYKQSRRLCENTRCALISPIDNDDDSVPQGATRYRVIDVETFLEESMDGSTPESKEEKEELTKFWKEKGNALMDVCTAEEVHELIPALEKKIPLVKKGKGFSLCYGLLPGQELCDI